jgi:hypothetical protein
VRTYQERNNVPSGEDDQSELDRRGEEADEEGDDLSDTIAIDETY